MVLMPLLFVDCFFLNMPGSQLLRLVEPYAIEIRIAIGVGRQSVVTELAILFRARFLCAIFLS